MTKNDQIIGDGPGIPEPIVPDMDEHVPLLPVETSNDAACPAEEPQSKHDDDDEKKKVEAEDENYTYTRAAYERSTEWLKTVAQAHVCDDSSLFDIHIASGDFFEDEGRKQLIQQNFYTHMYTDDADQSTSVSHKWSRDEALLVVPGPFRRRRVFLLGFGNWRMFQI